MSEIFIDIDYIDLEYVADLDNFDGFLYITLDNKHIIAYNNFQDLYLFERETGKFIRKIDIPVEEELGEMNLLLGYFDVKDNLYYKDLLWWGKWIGIDPFTSKIKNRIIKPKSFDVANFLKLGDGNYISMVNNHSGNNPYLLVIYDENGNVISKVKNNRQYLKSSMDTPHLPANFYTSNGSFYFHEILFGDTIYEIIDNQIFPHTIFEMGKYKPSYKFRDMPDANKGRYLINSVYETNKTIYFSYSLNGENHFGYFNKETSETFIHINENKDINISYNLNDQLTFIPSLSGDMQLKISNILRKTEDESETLTAIVYWLK